MSRHDPSISLRQMRDHAHELADIVRGQSRGDNVDHDIVWEIVTTDIPELVAQLQK